MSKKWWRIFIWVNAEYITSVYISAKDVKQTGENSLLINDETELVYEEEIESIELTKRYSFNLIEYILKNYIQFELNNSENWKKLEELLPGIICNSELNTLEIID